MITILLFLKQLRWLGGLRHYNNATGATAFVIGERVPEQSGVRLLFHVGRYLAVSYQAHREYTFISRGCENKIEHSNSVTGARVLQFLVAHGHNKKIAKGSLPVLARKQNEATGQE